MVQSNQNSVSFGEIWGLIAPIKWSVLLGGILGLLLGWGLSHAFTPIYRATITMLPTKSPESSNGLGGIAGQMGGLAALAGINLGGSDSEVASIEYLRSSALARKFIISHDLMPVLFSGNWDADRHEFKAGFLGTVPTESRGVKRFRSSVVKIAEDKRTGLLTITVDWKDPNLAYHWANDLVSMANDMLRSRAIVDAKAAITYLNGEIEKTQSVQVREALSKIIETQLRTLSLANVREDYAFRVIDPAVLPEAADIASPKRSIFAIVGFLFGAVVLAVFRLRSRAAKVP